MEDLLQWADYQTELGGMFQGKFEEWIQRPEFELLNGKIQLIFTSPPFALNNKKRYDNHQGEAYKHWLASYAPIFRRLLTDSGSLVIEMGNAWEPRLPVMSTLALEALLDLKRAGDFYLCEQFVVHNPARLPSPAQWVTINRNRVTDSFTHIWWLSNTPYPKADNRSVLRPYSKAMLRLLERGTYNDGKRPSEHVVGAESFLKNNGGSIPKNVLEFSNTSSSDPYQKYCKENGILVHPARMNIGIPNFFIKFLTDSNDIVLDPFAGSNTTGSSAEALGRSWLAFEPVADYVAGSRGRFSGLD
ncbi:MAG TPA: site-specific DNA-methyltransferase [Promineifilum sp.]|nr:site-specific DNA-methyltransferase [Promineifilum sp.]HRO22888.1 site-specific DNA-methyltransferase [Promineifilum sp.]HRO89113.1 site-specific DNA-methyltransferase [Promineifilum sp.]HRQ13989.1 site-specific DNA-methyltransferase [Promineifilum sp.]